MEHEIFLNSKLSLELLTMCFILEYIEAQAFNVKTLNPKVFPTFEFDIIYN
jgi:hypothetical protein